MSKQADQPINPSVRPVIGTTNDEHVSALAAMLPSGLPRKRKRHESPPTEVFEVAQAYWQQHKELTPRLCETLAARAYWESQ